MDTIYIMFFVLSTEIGLFGLIQIPTGIIIVRWEIALIIFIVSQMIVLWKLINIK